MQIREFILNDGRTLEVYSTDVVSSKAVVFHHGTPSCAKTWEVWINELQAEGISAISYSRAGYSTSSRKAGRTVIDVNDDLAQVYDELGIDEFVAVGWSGGGPHALAAAFDSRCRGIVVIAGVGEYGVDDLDFLAGMGEDNEIEFGAALAGEKVLEEWMVANAAGFAKATVEDFRKPGNSLISAPDLDILQSEFAHEMVATNQQAFVVGYYGWMDDDLAFVLPWGFSVRDVNVPVHIWQGDQDLMVPAAHADWLHKHLPMSELHAAAGEGHLSIVTTHRAPITHNIAGLLAV